MFLVGEGGGVLEFPEGEGENLPWTPPVGGGGSMDIFWKNTIWRQILRLKLWDFYSCWAKDLVMMLSELLFAVISCHDIMAIMNIKNKLI